MSADDFLQLLTQALYFVAAVAVLVRAARTRRRVDVDAALLFGVLAMMVTVQWAERAMDVTPGPATGLVMSLGLMVLPHLMLRLLMDFVMVPPWVMTLSRAGLVLSWAGLIGWSERERPMLFILWCVLYFLGFQLYAAVVFRRESRRSVGITRRRLSAAAWGSALLGLLILNSGLMVLVPHLVAVWTIVGRMLGLSSGFAYFLGFTPPEAVRRMWQEPEMRAFLNQAGQLSRLETRAEILRELGLAAARAVGAPQARVTLYNETDDTLQRVDEDGNPAGDIVPAGTFIGGRVVRTQRPLFTADAARDDPANADAYAEARAMAILSAPVTSASRRFGVLSVYAPRPSLFMEDDLDLVALMATQGAIILENHELVSREAQARAERETTRIKDLFLSTAAHELKTPLTAIIAQAQLLHRKLQSDPNGQPDPRGIERLIRSAARMRGIVDELLDVDRMGRGQLVGEREPLDLVEVIQGASQELAWDRHTLKVDAAGPAVGQFDRQRMLQLFTNLLDNAIKYSPQGSAIDVGVTVKDGTVDVTVADKGIGIPENDLQLIFDRYHRAQNVNHKSHTGMGLGLSICRGIVTEHGGRIWAESTLGQGTTLHVSLPLQPPPRSA